MIGGGETYAVRTSHDLDVELQNSLTQTEKDLFESGEQVCSSTSEILPRTSEFQNSDVRGRTEHGWQVESTIESEWFYRK